MKIDFAAIQEEALVAFKGGEGVMHARMFVDEHNRIMRGRLPKGASIGMHTHEGSSEIIYILSGQGFVWFDGERVNLKAGDCHYCPMGHTHSLVNDSDEDLVFMAVVPQH